MIKHINITYGSKEILKKFKTEFPKRDFLTFASNNTLDSNLQLVDTSDLENVFKSGVSYEIKNYHGDIYKKGFFNYNFITIYPENLKLFESRLNSWFSSKMPLGIKTIYLLKRVNSEDDTYVILTVWNNPSDWQWWRKSNDYFFKPYINNPENKFHEANYESIDF